MKCFVTGFIIGVIVTFITLISITNKAYTELRSEVIMECNYDITYHKNIFDR